MYDDDASRIYDSMDDAIEREIKEFLINSGEAPTFFDLDAIAEKTLEEFTDEHGHYHIRPIDMDETAFGDIVLNNVLDIIGYSSGVAFAATKTDLVEQLVTAHNRGDGDAFTAAHTITLEKLDEDDIEAVYYQLITA